MAQLVKRLTSAQGMISSPMSGSMLTAHGLEPAPDSVSPSLSAFPHHLLKINIFKKLVLGRLGGSVS